MGIYSVINIDIVNSRNLKNRGEVQNTIKKYLNDLNKSYKNILLAPITLTLGDEWQIVLKKPLESYNMLKIIQVFLRNIDIEIYAGIGIGDITTEISNDTREMDGSAFVFAREALNIAKDKKGIFSKYIRSKDNKVYLKGEEISLTKNYNIHDYSEVAVTLLGDSLAITLNKLINSTIENNEALEKKITYKQREVINLYKEYGSYNEIIRINPKLNKSSISQKLNDANYFLIRENVELINSLIGSYIIRLEESEYGD